MATHSLYEYLEREATESIFENDTEIARRMMAENLRDPSNSGLGMRAANIARLASCNLHSASQAANRNTRHPGSTFSSVVTSSRLATKQELQVDIVKQLHKHEKSVKKLMKNDKESRPMIDDMEQSIIKLKEQIKQLSQDEEESKKYDKEMNEIRKNLVFDVSEAVNKCTKSVIDVASDFVKLQEEVLGLELITEDNLTNKD